MRSIVPPPLRPARRPDRRLRIAGLVAAVALLHGLALQALDGVGEPVRPAAMRVTALQVQGVVELPPLAATAMPAATAPVPPAEAATAALPVAAVPAAIPLARSAQAGPARIAHAAGAAAPRDAGATLLGSGTTEGGEQGSATALTVSQDAGREAAQPRAPATGEAAGDAAAAQADAQALPLAAVLPATAATAAAEAAAASAAATEEVPVYATRLPGPAQRRYRLQRGILSGEGEFAWQPASLAPGSTYEARLVGRVAGITVLDWTSRGRIDAAGVAPERFVVRRLGRDAQAANFQRDAGKITYSGPRTEFPLPAGAQDRLSWMVQLPGVLAAEPRRFAQPGATVNFFVSGARGDADVWVFRVLGSEPVSLADGREVQAIKLMREPRKPHDTRAEVWLEPAMSYLPARARLTPGGGGEPLELTRLPE